MTRHEAEARIIATADYLYDLAHGGVEGPYVPRLDAFLASHPESWLARRRAARDVGGIEIVRGRAHEIYCTLRRWYVSESDLRAAMMR